MRVAVILASIPIGVVTTLHWHWLKVHIIEHTAWWALKKLLHALGLFVRPEAIGHGPVLPIMDSAAVFNGAIIVGAIAFLLCAAAFPKARSVLVAGGLAGLAVGMSREIDRRNRQQQPRLAE